jgi:RND superfamily putative drug exporter
VGIEDLRESINSDPAFSNLSDVKVNEAGTLGAMSVFVAGDTWGPDARERVDTLRNEYIPDAMDGTSVEVSVGGSTAETTDLIDTMTQYLPIVMGFVLTLSFLLLMMVFRSIVIPIKAIIMNLLSVGAAYGLVVAVFQEGLGASTMGFRESDTIAAFLPVFMFAVLFGLSMDYHVFLLSRIQERFHATGDNSGAVAFGLRSTAQVITGAAAIMMVVFAGFSQGEMLPMQQVGFGLAVAVFMDATIVRTVLVPASMQCLGKANWYFPKWLSWLPEINVEGGSSHTPRKGGSGPLPEGATA